MKKTLFILLMASFCASAGFAGGRQEKAIDDPPETPSELEQYAESGIAESASEPASEEAAASDGTPDPAAETSAQDSAGADSSGPGEGPLELTVDKAVKIAIERNLNLKSKAIDVRTKRRNAEYAWNRLIPSAQVSGTMSRMNAEQEMSASQWSVSAGLDFTLNLNIALNKAIQSTQKDYMAQKISYEEAKAKLEKDVRKNFYNILLLQRRLELQKEQIETAEDRYEQAQINYENGLVPELQVLNAQVAYENQKPALQSMELGYRQALRGFKMNLGIAMDRELELEGSIEAEEVELDVQELVNEYLARRYDIRSLIASIETLDDQYTAQKLRALTPNLTLGLNFDPTFQKDPWENNWFSDISGDWSQRSGMFRMTISMSLDGLLPFSKTQVGLREMEDNLAKMRVSLQQAMRGAEMEIVNTVEQIRKSRETIETLQLNVERARRAYEMAEEAYNVGSKELLEVKDAEDELQKARVEVLKEKYNYVSALLDLEYAINAEVEEADKLSGEQEEIE